MEHRDTTEGSVVSLASEHEETGLRALSALTHRDILGTCFAAAAEASVVAQESNKPGACSTL